MQAAADSRRTVVVAGGRIGGVAAAIGLSRAGFRVSELGRLYHATDVERLVRNDLFRDKSPQDFYRSLDWIYGYGRGDS